jgi:hypothetical protein
VAGIFLGLIYTYYYTSGDTFNYFADGVRLAALAKSDASSYLTFLWSGEESHLVVSDLIYQQPRALFLSKVTSLFCLLTWNSYWVISLYYSAFSFLTGWILVRKVAAVFPAARIAAVIAVLFFPTVVLWSSGIIKESLAMGALFFLAYIFVKAWERENISIGHWACTAFFLWLLWSLKYYYLAIFLPVTVTTLVVRFLLTRLTLHHTGYKLLIWFLIFTFPVLLVSLLHPNFNFGQIALVIVSNYNEYLAMSAPEDVIRYHSLKPTFLSLALNSPWAVVSGIFRPFAWEARNALQILVAAENLLILLLAIASFRNAKRLVQNRSRLIIFSVLMYVLFLCAFLALSAPNFGTLSRYRVGFLPFLMLILISGNPVVNHLLSLKIFRRVVR